MFDASKIRESLTESPYQGSRPSPLPAAPSTPPRTEARAVAPVPRDSATEAPPASRVDAEFVSDKSVFLKMPEMLHNKAYAKGVTLAHADFTHLVWALAHVFVQQSTPELDEKVRDYLRRYKAWEKERQKERRGRARRSQIG